MSTGKTALSAVQAAVMGLLAADAGLMALAPGGVWDYVPADPTFPYICLEEAEEVPDDTYGAQVRGASGGVGAITGPTFGRAKRPWEGAVGL